MSVTVITAGAPLVSTSEAKWQCRAVEFQDDDDYLDRLVMAAENWLSGPPNGWLGRSLTERTLEYTLDRFPDCGGDIALPFAPVRDLLSVTYDATDGVQASFDPAACRIVAASRVALRIGQAWPITARQSDSVRVRYTAGYAAAALAEIAVVKQAILLQVAHWYQNREPADQVVVDAALTSLLTPLRIWTT